jgi:hypothetical protein
LGGLSYAQSNTANSRERLTDAKAMLDKMGIRQWDWDVREIERRLG